MAYGYKKPKAKSKGRHVIIPRGEKNLVGKTLGRKEHYNGSETLFQGWERA